MADDGGRAVGDGLVFGCVSYAQLADLGASHPVLAGHEKRPQAAQYAGFPMIDSEFPCFFYLASEAGELAVYTRAFPDTLFVDGGSYPWAWTGDLYTEPAFRGRGLATRLQQNSTALLHARGIARGSVFSTETTLHIYGKIGSRLVGYAPRYLLLKSLRPLLEAHLPWRGAARAVAAAAGPLLRLAVRARWQLGRARSGFGERLRAVAEDPATVENARFPDPCSRLPFAFDESLAQLAWKIRGARAGEADCTLYLLVDVRDQPQAYFVLRAKRQRTPLAGKYQDFNLLTLMHFGLFRDDPELYGPLLDQVLTIFWNSQAEVLEVIANCPALQAWLRTFGLLAAGKGMSFTVWLPASWRLARPVDQLSDWPLTHFRGDAFYF